MFPKIAKNWVDCDHKIPLFLLFKLEPILAGHLNELGHFFEPVLL